MYITSVDSDIPNPLKKRKARIMIFEIEAKVATKVKAEKKFDHDSNPWRVRGLMRYEEKDLAYADRKAVEAAQMSDPEEQRRHLQDVIELFAAKYFVEFTVEGLLRDTADFDLVYLHRMLAEAADDPRPSLDFEEVMAKYWEKYGYGDV